MLRIAKNVKLINRYKFAKTTLDKNAKFFNVRINILEILESVILMYLPKVPLLATLQKEKAPLKIHGKYLEYIDVFISDLVIKLTENIKINHYAIKLVKSK